MTVKQVKDESVPVEYMIDALVGFTSVYSKIPRRSQGAGLTLDIRIVGLRPNPTHILVDIIEWVKAKPAAATVSLAGGWGWSVFQHLAAE
jgi:hypothetical protein